MALQKAKKLVKLVSPVAIMADAGAASQPLVTTDTSAGPPAKRSGSSSTSFCSWLGRSLEAVEAQLNRIQHAEEPYGLEHLGAWVGDTGRGVYKRGLEYVKYPIANIFTYKIREWLHRPWSEIWHIE